LAAQDACHADVVMVSAHGSEELPDEVKTWFSQWIESRSPRKTALVALLDHAVGLLSQFDPAHAYLEQMAKQAGLQFVSMFIEQEETEMPIHQARSDLEEPPPQLEAFCRKVAQRLKSAPQPETEGCLTPAPTPP
jgi:hypothetical protein